MATCFKRSSSSRTLPAPRTTQASGSSATVTGSWVSWRNTWSRPGSNAPPPVSTMPVSIISAATSGGVRSRQARTVSTMVWTGSRKAAEDLTMAGVEPSSVATRRSQSERPGGRCDGLSVRGRRAADGGGVGGATGAVPAGAPSGQDASPRVRQTRGRTPTGAQLHALLRVESRRALCGQAEDRGKARDSEAARGPDGDVAPHAHTGAGAAWLAEQRVAEARRLLRSAEQLAAAGQLSPGDHAPLVSSR